MNESLPYLQHGHKVFQVLHRRCSRETADSCPLLVSNVQVARTNLVSPLSRTSLPDLATSYTPNPLKFFWLHQPSKLSPFAFSRSHFTSSHAPILTPSYAPSLTGFHNSPPATRAECSSHWNVPSLPWCLFTVPHDLAPPFRVLVTSP